MRRREFISILCGAAAASQPIAAQTRRPEMPVIGFLSSGSPAAWAGFLEGFRRGLAEMGFVIGQNVRLEERWAEGQPDRLPRLTSELLDHRVSILVAVGGS